MWQQDTYLTGFQMNNAAAMRKVAEIAISCRSILVKVFNKETNKMLYFAEYLLSDNRLKTTTIGEPSVADKQKYHAAIEFSQDCVDKRLKIDQPTILSDWIGYNRCEQAIN